MQTSMAVLIAVIVVLITGLIVLTIFGGSISKLFAQGTLLKGQPCEDACTAYQQICTSNADYNQLPGCIDQTYQGRQCICLRASGGKIA